MSNFVYPKFVQDLLLGIIGDITAVTIKVTAINTSSFDKTDEFLADLGAVLVGTPVVLPSVTTTIETDGSVSVSCDDVPPLSLTGITSLDTVHALITYIDTGSSATSNLISHMDKRGDTSPVLFTGTGDPVPLDWPAGPFLKL